MTQDTPIAGEVLTAESVKLLKAGDLLQPLDGRRGFAFADRNRVVFVRRDEHDADRIITDIAGPCSWDRFTFVSRPTEAAPSPQGSSVDALAQEIRRVDGNHDLGAGALAEALMPFLAALSSTDNQGRV